MSADRSSDSSTRRILLPLVIAILALRLYICARVGLGDDEAYYWDWTRHLSLSYFDHPAMVAWLIKLGTLIFGHTPLGVRFFGFVCNSCSVYLLWDLARRMFSEKVAAISVVLYLISPIFIVGGLLMVPDAPMAFAWLAFLYGLYRLQEELLAERKPSLLLWLALGFSLGFGFLSKYTMLLVALSGLAVLLSGRRLRQAFRNPGFWLAIAIAAACCAPILIWNERLDWPSLKFHLHDRQSGGGGANFVRWSQFFVSQAIAVGPALFLLSLAVLSRSFAKFRDPRWRFLALVSSPPLAIFTAQALFAEFKPHWPAPAYPLLFIGVAVWYEADFGLGATRVARNTRRLVAAAVLGFALPVFALFNVGVLKPVLPKLARMIVPRLTWDPKFDPTNDLYGWDQAIARAQELRGELRAQGEREVFLSSYRYQLVAQIAFASGERAWKIGDGRDQYSFDQKPEELEALKGRSSIYIVDQRFERDPRNDKYFDSCEETKPLTVFRETEVARTFHMWVCRGFRGSSR